MKIYDEINLCDFDFWGGAADTLKYLTIGDLEQLQEILEDCYPHGIFATTLNDIFWFEDDWIADMLGFPDFDTLMKEREKEEQ